MKSTHSADKAITIAAYLVLVTAGTWVGAKTLARYPNTVQGLLGLATLMLVHFMFFPPKAFRSGPRGLRISLPQDLPRLVGAFAIAVVIYWSAHGFLQWIRNSICSMLC